MNYIRITVQLQWKLFAAYREACQIIGGIMIQCGVNSSASHDLHVSLK